MPTMAKRGQGKKIMLGGGGRPTARRAGPNTGISWNLPKPVGLAKWKLKIALKPSIRRKKAVLKW